MSDLIKREDAIKAVTIAALDDRDELEAIKALPSAELPKGDLISREDAVNAICKHSCYTEYGLCANVGFPRTACGYVEAIQLLPSAEAVQGEWINIDNYYRLATCSHCHKVTMFEKWGEYTKPYKFCPNCGAKMKGGGSE